MTIRAPAVLIIIIQSSNYPTNFYKLGNTWRHVCVLEDSGQVLLQPNSKPGHGRQDGQKGQEDQKVTEIAVWKQGLWQVSFTFKLMLITVGHLVTKCINQVETNEPNPWWKGTIQHKPQQSYLGIQWPRDRPQRGTKWSVDHRTGQYKTPATIWSRRSPKMTRHIVKSLCSICF